MKTEHTLPESCYGILLVDNSLIIINSYESGYYKVTNQPDDEFLLQELRKKGEPCGFINSLMDRAQAMNDFANQLNAEIGITIQQRRAMEWGSQFGWKTPLSYPDSYDEEGVPYSANNPRKQTV